MKYFYFPFPSGHPARVSLTVNTILSVVGGFGKVMSHRNTRNKATGTDETPPSRYTCVNGDVNVYSVGTDRTTFGFPV